jgi:hypothetical protein
MTVDNALELKMKQELETSIRRELEASIRRELEASIRRELEASIQRDLEASIRSDVEAKFQSMLSENHDLKRQIQVLVAMYNREAYQRHQLAGEKQEAQYNLSVAIEKLDFSEIEHCFTRGRLEQAQHQIIEMDNYTRVLASRVQRTEWAEYQASQKNNRIRAGMEIERSQFQEYRHRVGWSHEILVRSALDLERTDLDVPLPRLMVVPDLAELTEVIRIHALNIWQQTEDAITFASKSWALWTWDRCQTYRVLSLQLYKVYYNYYLQ